MSVSDAAQASINSQTSHMDQGMGRGQEHGLQAGTSSQTGQMICYCCRQPGYMRQDCPKR